MFYFFVLENDELSLKEVFDKKKEDGKPLATETDITIALAEHLLKKLAPGGSYKVDADSKHKKVCSCGCGIKPVFSYTGIGIMIMMIFIIKIYECCYVLLCTIYNFQF